LLNALKWNGQREKRRDLMMIMVSAAYITSVISGVFGMAGGILLMAVLSSFLAVGLAMIAHGVIQGVANGSRAWILRTSISWSVVFNYLGGLVAGALAAAAATFVPSKTVIFLSLGFVAFLPRILDRVHLKLDITCLPDAILCGFVMMWSQLVAGAAGPVLDSFFTQTSLGKLQVVATKAMTQVFSHVLKIAYFSWHLSAGPEVPEDFAVAVGVACLAAVAGTFTGKKLLDRLSEAAFKKYYRLVLETLGVGFIAVGVFRLVA